MAWVRIDDSFHLHPKVLRAGPAAIGLWVIALAHSSHYLTDGHVSPELVKHAVGRDAAKLSQALVDAGLWEANGNGWNIHDYHDYNPSKVEVLRLRAQRSDAGRRGGQAKTKQIM